jgi:hypothetical protein
VYLCIAAEAEALGEDPGLLSCFVDYIVGRKMAPLEEVGQSKGGMIGRDRWWCSLLKNLDVPHMVNNLLNLKIDVPHTLAPR